jgi:hypothetical protein
MTIGLHGHTHRRFTDLDEGGIADELERADRVRSRQLSRAITALLTVAAFLVGVPVLLDLFPQLDDVRLLGVPVSWLAVAVLPWPVLTGLAWWQLRRAESVENADDATPAGGAP